MLSHAGFMSRGPSGLPLLDALRQPLRSLLRRCAPCVKRQDGATIYQGHGQPVMVFPVLGGGPDSTAPLRRVLDQAGFVSYDWGMGANTGPRDRNFNRWLRELEEKVVEVAEKEGASVTLLGWSLGGIYARELAKRANPLIRQVITLGTPFKTEADSQQRCPLFRVLESGYGGMAVNLRHRLRQCPPVPYTSIYSKSDGLVPWQLCVEQESPIAENIEVDGASHRGLPAHPRVLEVITQRLAQPEGEWRPFERHASLALN
ncbi:MAG: alpha/beta hydrolase [Ramlibacter sp.]|nr:alpha/beta hydrolase [Ramlibacter sp.]